MELSNLLSFLSASIILTMIPGPDNIFVLTESITKGKNNGIALSFGLSLGVLVHTMIAATGFSIIIINSTIVFNLIKYLGVFYLFYLAIITLKEKRIEVSISENNNNFNFLKVVKKGFLMNVLNPKVLLFFIAFLPQFISDSGYNITTQMVTYGVVFMLQAFVIFTVISILSGKLSKYISNQKFEKTTMYFKVSVLGILGIVLALS